jgi:hypothetical protein
VLVVEVVVSVRPLFDVILSTALLLPEDVGEKRTVIVHVPSTATGDDVVQVSAVIWNWVPGRVTVPMESARPVPLLVRVMVCVLEF